MRQPDLPPALPMLVCCALAAGVALLPGCAPAKRPVVIAGSGVWWSGAEAALARFVERARVPLYTITMARGTVPDDHPLCMGYDRRAVGGTRLWEMPQKLGYRGITPGSGDNPSPHPFP